jgi:hypothetical protein
MEAYHRIVGTIEFRRPVPRRRLRLRPRWYALARSPSRTAIALRDAAPAAYPANAAWASAIDLTSTSSASSTPPVRTCCDDWLNSPLFTYIEGWYNPRRRHSALGQMSPANFESKHIDKARTPTPRGEHGLPTVGVCVAGATPPVDNPAPELIVPT